MPIVAGIWPLTSARNAEFMKNELRVTMPDEIIARMSAAGDSGEPPAPKACHRPRDALRRAQHGAGRAGQRAARQVRRRRGCHRGPGRALAFLTSFSQSPHGNEKAALHARPFTSLRISSSQLNFSSFIFTSGLFCQRRRNLNRNLQPMRLPVAGRHLAAVELHRGAHQGEPQTAAARTGVARVVHAIERLK